MSYIRFPFVLLSGNHLKCAYYLMPFDYHILVTYVGGVTKMVELERIKTTEMEHMNVTVGNALDIFWGKLDL